LAYILDVFITGFHHLGFMPAVNRLPSRNRFTGFDANPFRFCK